MVLPKFLIKRIPKQANIRKIRSLLNEPNLHTVCESAKCPNIGECFAKQSLTFMILGNVCTRNCKFCGVAKGNPAAPDPEEPQKIAKAVKKLGLNYVVITSVNRDDLADGGAEHFAKVINRLLVTDYRPRPEGPRSEGLRIEVLIPDFQGNEESLKIVLDAHPFVLNHNIETIPRLYPKIRPQANYQRSLKVLKISQNKRLYTKSGLMVGLGEAKNEVFSVLKDLNSVGCDIVTIGQYLPPSKEHLKAERYVHPDEFREYQEFGEKLGLLKVFSGPFVRSSYHAEEIYEKI